MILKCQEVKVLESEIVSFDRYTNLALESFEHIVNLFLETNWV